MSSLPTKDKGPLCGTSVRALHQRGTPGDPRVGFNSCKGDGGAHLHIAARLHRLGAVRLLLSRGSIRLDIESSRRAQIVSWQRGKVTSAGSTKLPLVTGWRNERGKSCPPTSITRTRPRAMVSVDASGRMEILSVSYPRESLCETIPRVTDYESTLSFPRITFPCNSLLPLGSFREQGLRVCT